MQHSNTQAETAVEAQTKPVHPQEPLARTAALSDDRAAIDMLKTGISNGIDFALTQYPVNTINNSTTAERTKAFAAHLSGCLEEMAEMELADKVFSIFKRSDA